MTRLRTFARPGVLWAAIFGLLTAVGCGSSSEIRSYPVPKATLPEIAKKTTPDAGGGMRLLGAMIPVSEQSMRFVKFSGPTARITPHEAAFNTFVDSIRVGNGEGPLEYKAPEGARIGNPRQMRQITFQFGEPGETVDLYISDPFGGNLLQNVNRWRGEVGLPDVTEAELPNVIQEVNLGGKKAYKMDFSGPGGKGGMMPPFAGGR